MTRWIVVLAVLALVVTSGTAMAEIWGTMGPPGGAWNVVPSITDALDDDNPAPNPYDGRDIYPGVWWQREGGFEYFRMDLAGTPSDADEDDWAELYSIMFDTGPGGADDVDVNYIPTGFTGVDYILDVHFADTGATGGASNLTLTGVHHHAWSAGSGFSFNDLLSDPDEYYVDFGGANTIQWRIPLADIGGNPVYQFCGVTHEIGDAAAAWDATACDDSPEPATVGLVLVSFAAIAAVRRRRNG